MKKKLSVIAVIILVLAICVSAWFYGYYNHESNDNLPTLAAIAEMSEADVNSLFCQGTILTSLERYGGSLIPVKTALHVGNLGMTLLSL